MDDMTVTIRLLLSVALAGTIGLERAWRGKPAGLRTHLLVALGATLTMLVSLHMADVCGNATVDPTRIAANVVVGLGFLGAGMIFRAGGSVHGLTTAAGLWAMGAVGLAVGCGFYTGAIVTWAIILFALHWLDGIERYLVKRAGPRLKAGLVSLFRPKD